MTDNSVSLYICKGCESEMDNSYGNCDKFDEFEACPLCMTLDELWQLRFGTKE
jgi:DNA replicative helicase MCM subunit Mcm2 (Cdc46/Mcm family)